MSEPTDRLLTDTYIVASEQPELILSWRDLPTQAQILTKINEFVRNLDTNGYTDMQNAESTAPSAVKWEDVTFHDQTFPVLLRYSHPYKRVLPRDTDLVAKMMVLVCCLVRVVATSDVIKLRQVLYNSLPGLNNNTIKKTLEDLSLTLGIHQWSMLIEAEETGKVSMGAGVKLTLDLISDVAKAAEVKAEKGMDAVFKDKGCCRKFSLNNTRVFDVPLKIMRVHNPRHTGIKAVLVLEHRNIGSRLAWFRESTRHVLTVMTTGYASVGTKEFLHLLWTQLPRSGPDAVRFLYCSDHDAFGLHQYALLKYGARKSAAMSRSYVCPELEWVGPTREVVLSRLDSYMQDTWVKENSPNPTWVRQRAHMNARRRVEARMAKGTIGRTAEEILRWMDSAGYLERDEVIRNEVESIRTGKAHFGLCILSLIQDQGLEIFLVDMANKATDGTISSKPLLHELRTQGQQLFDGFSSAKRHIRELADMQASSSINPLSTMNSEDVDRLAQETGEIMDTE